MSRTTLYQRAYRRAKRAIPTDREDTPSWECIGKRALWARGYVAGVRAAKRGKP